MSEFVYCLNTSTIRPTPLLEKIRIAGRPATRRSSPGTTRSTAYLAAGRLDARAEEGARRRRARRS